MNRCPTCNSPNPHLHPAVQHEGETQLCLDPWHATTEKGREAIARWNKEVEHYGE